MSRPKDNGKVGSTELPKFRSEVPLPPAGFEPRTAGPLGRQSCTLTTEVGCGGLGCRFLNRDVLGLNPTTPFQILGEFIYPKLLVFTFISTGLPKFYRVTFSISEKDGIRTTRSQTKERGK